MDIDELHYDRLAFWIKEASKFDMNFLTREENQIIRDAFAELLYNRRVREAVNKIRMSE